MAISDLVALEDLGREWDREIRACVQQVGAQQARLWSFGSKSLINRPETCARPGSRQSPIQAGPIWAIWWLPTFRESAMKELRLLRLHGIVQIRLDIHDPNEAKC